MSATIKQLVEKELYKYSEKHNGKVDVFWKAVLIGIASQHNNTLTIEWMKTVRRLLKK